MKTNPQNLDKFKAVWVSHSSISDFLHCPRLYYLRNIYKNPRTGRKMTLVSPPLSLGQAVHEVVESLSILPVNERFATPLTQRYDLAWQKVTGEKGGFKNQKEETEFKQKGLKMLKRVKENPGPISNKAVKIKAEGNLPYYWFSPKDNIILCGKIDWIEYQPKDDSIHIIDFKTGKTEETNDSLQLPIYLLLASNTQKRKVKKVSYWYLSQNDNLTKGKLPKKTESFDKIYEIAKRIKLARQINHFKCPKDGCFYCRPFENILRGETKSVGVGGYNQDLFM